MSGLVASVEEPSVEDLVRATDTFRVTQLLVIVSAICLNMLDGFDVTAMAFSAHQIGMDLQLSPNSLGIVFSVALAGMMLGAIFVQPLFSQPSPRPSGNSLSSEPSRGLGWGVCLPASVQWLQSTVRKNTAVWQSYV